MDTTTTSPGRFTSRTRAMRSSATASDRLGRKSMPGLVAVAAQLEGIPLEAAPQDKTTC